MIEIVSIAVSRKKGTPKSPVKEALLLENHGLEGDAHAEGGLRQVSILSSEQIVKAREKGLDVSFGDFAENIATKGVDWKTVPIGAVVRVGKTAVLEITQIGKTCHNKCAIYYKAGDCIMPQEGVFARVVKGGKIACGDEVKIMERGLKNGSTS